MPNSHETAVEPMPETAVHVIIKEPVPFDIVRLIAETHRFTRESADILRTIGVDAFVALPHFTNPDVQVTDPYILLTEIRGALGDLSDILSTVDDKTIAKVQALISNPIIKKILGL